MFGKALKNGLSFIATGILTCDLTSRRISR